MSLHRIQYREQQDRIIGSRQPKHTELWGVVVQVEGSIYARGHEGDICWIAEYNRLNSSRLKVRCSGVNVVEGLPVWCEPDENPPFLKISSVRTELVPPQGTDQPLAPYNVPPHAVSHEWKNNPGIDVVRTYQPAFQPLKTVARGSLTIYLEEYIYVLGGRRVFFPGRLIDFSLSMPSVGKKKSVIVYLDKTTNQAATVFGDEVTNSTAINAPVPLFPSASQPSSFLELRDGQTVINQSEIFDARQTLDSTAGVLPTLLDNQIIIGEGGQLIGAWPVVDEQGNIITDNSGHIVYNTRTGREETGGPTPLSI